MKEFLGKLYAIWAHALKKVCQPHPRLKVKRHCFEGAVNYYHDAGTHLSWAGFTEECKELMV